MSQPRTLSVSHGARRQWRWMRWLFWGLAAAFAVYRIASFTPQPLDAADTLRPVFNRVYVAALDLFPTPQSAFAAWRGACLFLQIIPPILASLHWLGRGGRTVRSRNLFFISIGVSLAISRFPTLVDFQFNPDEGEFLSAAQKLFYDGNFFHAVDTGTSGPGNIYPLMLPAVLGISPDFASSRVLVLLIAFSVIYLLYRTVRLVTEESLARIAVLPLFAAFVSFLHPNLVHYSSEQIPLLLIALAAYVSVRMLSGAAAEGTCALCLGALVSLAFFSKMQSVPIIGALGAVSVSWRRNWRLGLLFVTGMASLPILNVILCASAGVLRDFWMSYIVANHRYANEHGAFWSEIPGFLRYLTGTSEIRNYLIVALCIGVSFALLRFRAGAVMADTRWFAWLSFLSLGAAVFAIYMPHRYFPHYLVLMLTPLSLAIAWMLARQASRSGPALFPALFVLLTVAGQGSLWASQNQYRFRNVLPTVRAPEGDLIRSLTSSTASIFVWGWTPDPYLSSGRFAATRDLNLFYLFLAAPEITSYYRERCLDELRKTKPELFVDAVGPTSWFTTDARRYGFEQIPEMQWFVASNYIFLGHAYGQRFYLRQDLVKNRARLFAVRHCATGALVCLEMPFRGPFREGATVSWVPRIADVAIPRHAALEVEFTPMARQGENALVFDSEDPEAEYRGMRLESSGGDRYRLAVGLGTEWFRSKPIVCPAGRLSSVSLEVDRNDIWIRGNGALLDHMKLPKARAEFTGPFTIGSRNDWRRTFTGTVSFLQVLDLEKKS